MGVGERVNTSWLSLRKGQASSGDVDLVPDNVSTPLRDLHIHRTQEEGECLSLPTATLLDKKGARKNLTGRQKRF